MTRIKFNRIIAYKGDENQVIRMEEFAFHESIPFYLCKAENEVRSLAKTKECSFFIFPEGFPKQEILENLYRHGNAWWVWDSQHPEEELALMEQWLHSQHGADPFSLYCSSIIHQVSKCLIPDFSLSLEPTKQLILDDCSHYVFCEAPSKPFNFKIEIFYNLAQVMQLPAFSMMPSAFVEDFFNEIANQFLGRLNQSVQYEPFDADIRAPQSMGFNFRKILKSVRLQHRRNLFINSSTGIQMSISVMSYAKTADPNFEMSDYIT